jgi:ribonuclease HI
LKTFSVKPPPKISPQPLEDFLSKHGLVHGQWDLLLFGDGSGLSWDMGGGFAAILFDGRKGIRSHLIGAQSLTTVNRMELGAYTQALAYHHECILSGALTDPPYRTFIFTDSEFTAKAGRKQVEVRKNLDLWQLMNWYELQGYRFNWRWVPRNSTPYHELADYLAGTARYAINSVNIEGDKLHSMMPYSVQFAEEAELHECPTCKTPLAGEDSACPICGPVTKG